MWLSFERFQGPLLRVKYTLEYLQIMRVPLYIILTSNRNWHNFPCIPPILKTYHAHIVTNVSKSIKPSLHPFPNLFALPLAFLPERRPGYIFSSRLHRSQAVPLSQTLIGHHVPRQLPLVCFTHCLPVWTIFHKEDPLFLSLAEEVYSHMPSSWQFQLA